MSIKNIQIDELVIKMESSNDMVVYSLNKSNWETHTLRNWIKYLKLDNVKSVFDIGAYTGIYSLFALHENVMVNAFEPLPRIYDRLLENVTANCDDFVNNHDLSVLPFTGLPIALSSFKGTSDFQITNNIELPSGSSITEHPTRSVKETIEVEVDMLDSFFNKECQLMKIDVERHEEELIKGGIEYFTIHKPVLFIELLNSDSFDKIKSLLFDCGYSKIIFSNDKEMENKNTETFIDEGNYIFE